MNKNKKILIAHYNENLDWLNNLNFDGEVIIYSKTIDNDKNKFIPINKGQEIPMYLKYIIDNYYILPDKTLFLHGHLNSPHQDFNSKFIVENVNWEFSDFFSVNKRDWYQEVSSKNQISKGSFDIWLKTYWYLFEEYLLFPSDGLFFYSGAQFVVDKSLILQYPINFYEKLYNWVLTENINIPPQTSDEISSRIFEYVWHYIFTKNPIENKRINNEIFKNL
jgi:hypothetical protein